MDLPLGIGSPAAMAESVFVQGIRKALGAAELIQRISKAAALKRQLLEKLKTKIEEREKSSLYSEEICQDVKLPYRFADENDSRHWIRDLFMEDDGLSDTEDSDDEITEQEYKQMLKTHAKKRKCLSSITVDPYYSKFMHYSSDFVNNENKWPSHKKSFKKVKKKKQKPVSRNKREGSSTDAPDQSYENATGGIDEALATPKVSMSSQQLKKKKAANIDAIRRKHWKLIAKKDIPKAYRVRSQIRSTQLGCLRKAIRESMKRKRAITVVSLKVCKDKIGRARRITREMQLFWKKYSKVEKVHRKKAEKHALEQIRLDEEMREAKRQQRKLNFLISQTELFAHFMSKKLSKVQEGGEGDERMKSIMESLEKDYVDDPNIASSNINLTSDSDEHDGRYHCEKAMENVKQAIERQRSQTAAFDDSPTDKSDKSGTLGLVSSDLSTEEVPQPSLFKGSLKSYQLKGMNWLVNLYEQGINGILADEMGLGKTVQTIAFLGHLAEKINIWGPFLVVAPASTLNNWHQEFTKFFPDFKVLPYWGNPADRKVLRKFWNQKASYHSDRNSAPFHILITSYQLVISDVRYFQRIKWQYMVLDEAQALKSTSSVRWKILLEYNCRNRLLLTGTPIQNTMAELWALLHFIMPSLFDSHSEFNEWFSKDIENHIENKSNIDETHLSRLHMILKPFMLRRIKRDVENELSEKIEVRVHCGLAPRQKSLYNAIKQNIKLEDLLKSTGSTFISTGSGHTLMNLVMQFRKVCNHPDLFERREVTSPVCFEPLPPYLLPKQLYREGMLSRVNRGKQKLLYCDLSIHHPSNVHAHCQSGFSFLRLLHLSVNEYCKVMTKGIHLKWWLEWYMKRIKKKLYFAKIFHEDVDCSIASIPSALPIEIEMLKKFCVNSPFAEIIFTHPCSLGYTHHENIGPTYQSHSNLHCIRGTELVFLPMIFQRIFMPPVVTTARKIYCCDTNASNEMLLPVFEEATESLLFGPAKRPHIPIVQWNPRYEKNVNMFSKFLLTGHGLTSFNRVGGWSNIHIPEKEYLVTDSGKLYALDILLRRLKDEGHRVLIYSQMTRMIDILEEYMWYRRHTYIRLDGSSRISERRDMVADFQTRSDIFAFLLSTRAGGLGINLTAADTVIFYDSDWNPTVDQQAMDRAHRLGQTKQVTVYRLVCEGTVDERILQRAEEKNVIQRMVISGGNFKPDILKTKEVVSLLLDDEQLLQRLKMRREENKGELLPYKGKKRGRKTNAEREAKRLKQLQEQGVTGTVSDASSGNLTITHSESNSPVPPDVFEAKFLPSIFVQDGDSESGSLFDSTPASPASEVSGNGDLKIVEDDTIIVDDVPLDSQVPSSSGTQVRGRMGGRGRGRPRIRPVIPETQKRRSKVPALRSAITRRRASRVRRVFTGRAAAMAGARAGAAAASAATYATYGYGLEPTGKVLSQQKEKQVSNRSSIT